VASARQGPACSGTSPRRYERAVFGSLTGISALAALFVGILLAE
jgi:hypothetical protein